MISDRDVFLAVSAFFAFALFLLILSEFDII